MLLAIDYCRQWSYDTLLLYLTWFPLVTWPRHCASQKGRLSSLFSPCFCAW